MEAVNKFRNRIIWGVGVFLAISIILITFREPNDSSVSIMGCWFPFLCFVIGFTQNSFGNRLLISDIPFVLTATIVGLLNVLFSISGYNEAILVYLLPTMGFLPYSGFYFLFVILLFMFRWVIKKFLSKLNNIS